MSRDTRYVDKNQRRFGKVELSEIAHETLRILDDGVYYLDDNSEISIADDLAAAVAGTTLYTKKLLVDRGNPPPYETVFTATKQTTLEGCAYLAHGCESVVALNFASARHPGGGFLTGANAQEESIARSSGLYACIRNNELYEINARNNFSCLYSHSMVHSPRVPVFGNDRGKLLKRPYLVSFISAPAPNAYEATKRGVSQQRIDETMLERIDRVLALALEHKHDGIVLGAYGCGVFGNDVRAVAGAFRQLLSSSDKYGGCFKHVHFATTGQEEYDVLARMVERLTQRA